MKLQLEQKKSDNIKNIVENGIEINDPKLVAEKFKESKTSQLVILAKCLPDLYSGIKFFLLTPSQIT